MGYKAVIEEARKVVGDGPTYISFDVDALDPVYAPGTGTPEVGGYCKKRDLHRVSYICYSYYYSYCYYCSYYNY